MKRRLEETDSSEGGSKARVECPFLDTVNRRALNFDLEKVCSVTLSKQNVYACLICGKFFQGRGPGTPAETHSVQANHFVFLNLQSCEIYCLPEDYKVIDTSLDDIRQSVRPSFNASEIIALDSNIRKQTDVFGTEFTPGFGPMNELTGSDFFNTTVQALAQVQPLRDFFLLSGNYAASKSAIVHLFGELVRKIWNSKRVKATVSAREFAQAVAAASDMRFTVGQQADASEFLKWLLHELHAGLGGSSKPGSSIVHHCFQGEVEITLEEIPTATKPKQQSVDDMVQDNDMIQDKETAQDTVGEESAVTTRVVPALMLSLDLPVLPLFKDSKESKSDLPTIPLAETLAKFDGAHPVDVVKGGKLIRRTFKITKLAPYIILHINRFTKTSWGVEKNRSIVELPVTSLDMSPFLFPADEEIDPKDLDTLSTPQLKALANKVGVDTVSVVDKSNLVELVRGKLVDRKVKEKNDGKKSGSSKRSKLRMGTLPASLHPVQTNRYSLVASICHRTNDEVMEKIETDEKRNVFQDGCYIVDLYSEKYNQWFEIQNLQVRETMPQLIARSEAYITIFKNLSDSNNP